MLIPVPVESRPPVEGRWPMLLRDLSRAQGDANRFLHATVPLQVEFGAINLWTSAERAVLSAALPGVDADELDVSVQRATVVLRGRRRDRETIEEGATLLRAERAHGPFMRSVSLPFRVDSDKVEARFELGVLTLELPRPAEDTPRQIKITRSQRSPSK